MKLEYGSKSLEYDGSGAVSATKVTLVNANGANVPILLPADKISLSNTELFELALESLYEENFPNRAENEKFSKVDAQIQENKNLTAKMEQATTENKENLDTVSAITEVLIALAVSQMVACLLMLMARWLHSSSHLLRTNVTTTETSSQALTLLKLIRNGQRAHKLFSSFKCNSLRATHTKSSHLLKCYNKVS